ncbi:probable RNA-directed DNA polymerase from transposon X-element [Trichonephila clavipes]|nr:probable RNA-directed DNA polymerase from transposon X-element [Trichonephila clavipes]
MPYSEAVQGLLDALDQRYSALALFVDFEAAFDKVWRLKCIQKLQTLGVCNNMLMWIRNFISQRFSAVRFGNAISSFKQSETGLPQGTVISPILFNIFINDLPDLLASDGLTNTALFADDLAIWCSRPKRDQSKLNTILNLTLERLHLWCIENNMTVNLKKTTCQFFTLNRQPFSPQLVYNSMPVQQSDVSIYLGCALDNKLKWTKHAELVVSKARKRLSILKRLTGVKWGCNRDTLNTTYKTYIQPVLNYCNEVLISASESVRKLLDTFHNQALRMITGGVKTTPVLAMQLLCDLQPFTNIIEKNAAILFNRLIRLPNNSFWREYDSDGGRNLKTQKGFIQCVPLKLSIPASPSEEWLHIYTDGSLLDFAQGAGIGVFSHLFSFYLHAGPLTTHFDDSTSALQALSNYNENNCLRVQNCRELLGKIKGKIVFQWVPSHCGLWGNERADFLAKKGTGILQNFRRDLTLHSAKLEIKRIFRESFRLTASRVARDKPWSLLCKKSHGIPSSPRAAAVAKFRLLTGHDCLCAHLFRFNLVTSPICVLCDTGQDMTAAHLDECSALNDLNCIVKRYWRARCLMT